MAAKHKFSMAKSNWMQINWNFGFEKKVLQKNIVEEFFIQNFKMADWIEMAPSTTVFFGSHTAIS
jgi:hypothetical protein